MTAKSSLTKPLLKNYIVPGSLIMIKWPTLPESIPVVVLKKSGTHQYKVIDASVQELLVDASQIEDVLDGTFEDILSAAWEMGVIDPF